MSRRALPFVFFAAILLAALAAGYRLYVNSRDRAVQQFQDRQLQAAHVVAATLESEMIGLSRTLRTLAAAVSDQPDDRVRQRQLEEQLRCAQPPCFAAAALYDADGRVRLASPREVSLPRAQLASATAWAFRAPDRTQVHTALATSENPALVLLTSTPARRAGTASTPAMIAAEVDFDSLFARQSTAAAAWPRESMLVLDGAGNVLFHSQHPEMRLNNVRKRNHECFSCHETFWYVDEMLARRRGVVQYSLHGVPHLGAFAPLEIEGQPWIAAVMGPTEAAVTVVAAQGRQLGLVMLATLLALGTAVQVTWKDRRRGLQMAADAAQKAHLERSHQELTSLNARLESAALEWRTTIDTIDAALMVLEPAGRIERMNRAAAEMLPAPLFSLLGEPSERLAEHPPWDTALRLAREAIEQNTIGTARVTSGTNGRTWDLWCRTTQRTGRSHSVVVVARDVTAVIELQESLRRSETMAALGAIIAGVAHEVRSPLFAISSLLDAWSIQKNGNAAPFQDALRCEVRRLTALMNELLEYGTPSKPNPQRYPLAPIIHEAVRSCEHEAQARGVRIVAGPPTDAELWVDPQRFVRVLINVIQNAIQHAPEGSEVAISTIVRSGLEGYPLQIVVRDHGPGFREEDLPRVFSPFFSRRAGGFGLGLAISGRIVSEHRGRITAANHPEGGAMVSVSLPMVQPEIPVLQGAQSC